MTATLLSPLTSIGTPRGTTQILPNERYLALSSQVHRFDLVQACHIGRFRPARSVALIDTDWYRITTPRVIILHALYIGLRPLK
jgi:hypothetical protein